MPYGMYFAGPNGIGKSVTIYTLVCLAKAMGWLVVYIPQCDEWISRSAKKEDIYQYFLDFFALAIAENNFYNNPVTKSNLENCKTWGDLVMYGKNFEPMDAVKAITDELCGYTTVPVLLVFDEVNALYEMKLDWTNNLPYETPPFSYMAATLNRLTMQRGWKIITGELYTLYELMSIYFFFCRYRT